MTNSSVKRFEPKAPQVSTLEFLKTICAMIVLSIDILYHLGLCLIAILFSALVLSAFGYVVCHMIFG
ncbi:MAG: hypothetical protein LBT23_10530 [Synergistaceae bacterium]|nr:hypothetical protein [Synergistaceae bacterium]